MEVFPDQVLCIEMIIEIAQEQSDVAQAQVQKVVLQMLIFTHIDVLLPICLIETCNSLCAEPNNYWPT